MGESNLAIRLFCSNATPHTYPAFWDANILFSIYRQSHIWTDTGGIEFQPNRHLWNTKHLQETTGNTRETPTHTVRVVICLLLWWCDLFGYMSMAVWIEIRRNSHTLFIHWYASRNWFKEVDAHDWNESRWFVRLNDCLLSVWLDQQLEQYTKINAHIDWYLRSCPDKCTWYRTHT